jgi:hypothetical protein
MGTSILLFAERGARSGFRRTGVGLASTAALVLIALSASAQQRLEIPATPTCPRCTFEKTKVLTIAGTSDSVMIAQYPDIVRDRRGRFYVSGANYNVLAFDSVGRFLGTMGRRGPGPGEFSTPPSALLIGRADSLYALSGRALSVFSPAFVHARTSGMQSYHLGAATLPSGEIVWHGPDASAPRDGYSLVLLDAKGTQVRTLRAAVPATPPCRECSQRTLSISPDRTSIWTAARNRYEIEQLSPDGRLLRTVSVRGSPWFEPWTAPVPRDRAGSTRPPSRLGAAVEDGQGRLWVMGFTAASDWKPDPSFDVSRRGIGIISPAEQAYRARSFAMVLEVLDLRSGRLIASQRFDRDSFAFLGGGLAWTTREDADGNTLIDIWRLSLREPAPR